MIMNNVRQQTILRLIRSNHIRTQEELQKLLYQEGFPVTQATISRDIRALNLMKKANSSGIYCYHAPEAILPPPVMLAQNVIHVCSAGNIVSIKCLSGMAQAVCTVVDSMENQEIRGTLAGDDTIFVLVTTPENAQLLSDELNQKLLNR